MHADEHAGAMYMTMTMMRPGLFFQREGPESESGNSLLCPDGAHHAVFCVPCLRDGSQNMLGEEVTHTSSSVKQRHAVQQQFIARPKRGGPHTIQIS